jgi:hypothetical protein
MDLVRGLYVLRRAWNVLITQLVQDAHLAFTSIPQTTLVVCVLLIAHYVWAERFVVCALLATP